MPGEKDIIIQHALESRENLEMTLGIHFAGDELCKQLIKDFLMKLRECLNKRLNHLENPQWEFVDTLLEEPLRSGSLFAFAKTSWNERCLIGIQRYHGRIGYGVVKRKESRERIPGLEQAINNAMSKAGKSSSWWEWHCDWEDCYGNWNTKKALLNIKYDEEAVHQLCKLLIHIMEVADEYVSSNP